MFQLREFNGLFMIRSNRQLSVSSLSRYAARRSYARWENFAKVIEKAITACHNNGYDQKDHFLGITKMVDLGSGAKRQIGDIGHKALNRAFAKLGIRQMLAMRAAF
jgi:hypothetical protein